MIKDFVPVARALDALSKLKIISFGPRPLNFMACNAPIGPLFNLGVEIEENSELDLFELITSMGEIPHTCKGKGDGGRTWRRQQQTDNSSQLAQYELTLLDWIEAHKGFT